MGERIDDPRVRQVSGCPLGKRSVAFHVLGKEAVDGGVTGGIAGKEGIEMRAIIPNLRAKNNMYSRFFCCFPCRCMGGTSKDINDGQCFNLVLLGQSHPSVHRECSVTKTEGGEALAVHCDK